MKVINGSSSPTKHGRNKKTQRRDNNSLISRVTSPYTRSSREGSSLHSPAALHHTSVDFTVHNKVSPAFSRNKVNNYFKEAELRVSSPRLRQGNHSAYLYYIHIYIRIYLYAFPMYISHVQYMHIYIYIYIYIFIYIYINI